MRAFLLGLLVVLQVTAQAVCCRCQSLDNGCGQPSEALLEVLETFCIPHDGSWQSIQTATEEAWLGHGRNVDLTEIPPIADHNLESTYSLFTRLEMTQTFAPQEACYDYGVILGSLAQIVRHRLWFLKKAWEGGVRFTSIVLFAGDRPLDPTHESEAVLIDPASSPYPFREGWKFNGHLPQNETEMMKLIYEQLDLPKAWREMPLVVVDAPKPAGMKRPHTEHTLLAWLQTHPASGSLLVISNQPFICRQDAVLRPLLPLSFDMESAGPGFPFERLEQEKRGTAILLAELAYRIKLYCQAASANASSPCLSSAPCL